jgi:hypothetical protein
MSTPHQQPIDPAAVAVELAKLRGEMTTGHADIKGSLSLLVQRAGQTDQIVADQREDHDALADRVTVVERRQWFASGMAAALGTAAGYAFQLLTK